jgi:DNA-binding beta-propeller fold protein YncE
MKELEIMGLRFATLVALLLAGGAAAAAAPPQFRVVQRLALDAGAVVESAALDVESRDLYLARGDKVVVVNADTGATVATIPVGGSVNNVVVAPDLHRAFATDGAGGRLAIIDGATHRVVRTVAVTRTPSALTYYRPLHRVFVGDATRRSLVAVDGDSGKAVGSLTIPDGVGQLAANSYGQVFVSSPTTNRVHYVDAAAVTDLGATEIATGRNCAGLALDLSARRFFSACANGHIAVVDTDVGMTIFDLAGPAAPASGAAFAFAPVADWRGGAFFLGEGGLSSVRMISPSKYAAGSTAPLPSGTRAFVIDTRTKRLLAVAPSASGWEIVALSN